MRRQTPAPAAAMAETAGRRRHGQLRLAGGETGFCITGAASADLGGGGGLLDDRRSNADFRRRALQPAGADQPAMAAAGRRLAARRCGGGVDLTLRTRNRSIVSVGDRPPPATVPMPGQARRGVSAARFPHTAAALRRRGRGAGRARSPDGPPAGALRRGDGVADPHQVVGLADDDSVQRYRTHGAQPAGKRSALGQAGEPQPLIEPPARRCGRAFAQASFNSRNLAKGWPSRGECAEWPAAVSRRRRGRATKVSTPSAITAR